jgi:hypothetical protein
MCSDYDHVRFAFGLFFLWNPCVFRKLITLNCHGVFVFIDMIGPITLNRHSIFVFMDMIGPIVWIVIMVYLCSWMRLVHYGVFVFFEIGDYICVLKYLYLKKIQHISFFNFLVRKTDVEWELSGLNVVHVERYLSFYMYTCFCKECVHKI